MKEEHTTKKLEKMEQQLESKKTEKQDSIPGIVRNSADRVENDKELQSALHKMWESEQRIKNVLDNLQDAYFEADLSGCFVKVNDSAVKMYGFESVDEMMYTPALNLYANENDRARMISVLTAQDKLVDYVCLGKRKDNTKFWVSMNVKYIYDSDGKIAGTVGVVRDITERKIQDEKIKLSEENYRNIYDNAIEGMYRTSLDGKCLQANNALANILGYSSAAEILMLLKIPESRYG
jgi:PAS domain S-box